MDKDVYQEITFSYSAPKQKWSNHEEDVYVGLTNDYSYRDVIEAFVEFSKCIGFDLNRKDILDELRNYLEEGDI